LLERRAGRVGAVALLVEGGVGVGLVLLEGPAIHVLAEVLDELLDARVAAARRSAREDRLHHRRVGGHRVGELLGGAAVVAGEAIRDQEAGGVVREARERRVLDERARRLEVLPKRSRIVLSYCGCVRRVRRGIGPGIGPCSLQSASAVLPTSLPGPPLGVSSPILPMHAEGPRSAAVTSHFEGIRR
jgi:hypothetical protein